MRNHYLVFEGGRGDHSVVHFARGASVADAMRSFASDQFDSLRFEADGSVWWQVGRTVRRYPHILAYIEEGYKTTGEWQIRELPGWVWDHYEGEVLCGEQLSMVEGYIADCRPLLRREFPRSRAPGFVWYLHEGPLVTFYRRIRPYQIEVLARYLIRWQGAETIVPWSGSYDDLLKQLVVRDRSWRDAPGTNPASAT